MFPCLIGYPGNYKKNKILSNLKKVNKQKNVEIFHAGTKLVKNKFYSNGEGSFQLQLGHQH